ncbi:MAG: hypothetical protein C4527_12695 [Candidatus Omnitrophota bacterium]|jgi:lysophospholipase L1-like esterase|nr:MAG: hypothetical protein C4527_12695 [Candidatus Omnitrophota bacterium]
MRNKNFRFYFTNILIIVASFLFLCFLLELCFRWFSGAASTADKQREFIERLAVPDSYGIVRPYVRLDLREFFPTGRLIDYPVLVSTNSFGMRMQEVELKKPDGVIRIAAMGDSCTFGWMTAEEDAYPRVLERLLNERTPQKFEVLNFGVPGYTSFHGLLQYERLVKRFRPDILILAFGFNDWYESRMTEAEFYERLRRYDLTEGLSGFRLFLYDHSAFGKWLLTRLRSGGRAIIEEEIRQRAEKDIWRARVPREQYQDNLRRIVADARTDHADCVILHLNLPNTWVKQPLQELAREMKIPFFDVQDLFESQIPSQIINAATHFGLQSQGVETGDEEDAFTLLFRVHVPEPVPIADSIYLVGNHAALGDWRPNTVAMFDDGAHGDEKAGDRIWSLQVTVREPIMLDYTFTNSGPRGKWIEEKRLFENPDKAIRHYAHVDLAALPPGSTWRSPVHTLDKIPYDHLLIPADPIHPNKDGHLLIAELLLPLGR